jgi:single-stranded-DNA-specific exonuclease
LNAAGRLGQAQLGVELLTTESTERASALAEYLHELNSSRDSLERSIYLAAQPPFLT